MTVRFAQQAGFRPAARMAEVGVSKILAIGNRAAEMKRAGRPTIILGAGEPDFDTPDHIKHAAAEAMARGETKYTRLDGSPEMKAAVIEKFRRDNALEFSADEITVSTGAKQVIFNAFMATLDPGDEVIVATPCWTSYIDIVNMAEGTAVEVPCDDASGFRLTPRQLEAAITPKTRWVLLNSPSNPTGAAYSAADYAELAEVLRRHPHVWLMVDDMYEHIVYEGFAFVTPLQVAPDLRDRTLTINGVSKAYAMTGWRIGYGAGPAALIKVMAAAQSQSTSCPSSISQAGAVAALTGPQDFLPLRAADFQKRRDLVVAGLNAIDGITCRVPEGAFYTFANCSGLIGRTAPDGTLIDSDTTFCNWVLETADVAMVPGDAFGVPNYFRISYATSETELTEALARLTRACATLCP
ncbi:pyridoxal phosphate-dependent aminotransferase [Alloyangia pacifica]|uniref:Aminotransferase n=1 Tax=Alloyangia pacifica TaxID=311180 RepID=A0A1I6UUJ6_9RHOB|nr:pyridoxal phosphate-dependent aminotransferase [Alloyangia pacifica]SDI53743.1 aspartate aminotransferase [Alloyangia pacifica]SFT05115.1 aspartate aminotransferase [Alloyangia pacifica]